MTLKVAKHNFCVNIVFGKINYFMLIAFTLIMFYPDMSNTAVEFKGEGEDVVVVTAVSHDERSVRLIGQYLLSSFP